MKINNTVRMGLGVLILGTMISYASAAKWELHPYAGGFYSGGADLKDEGIYGVKGG